MINPLEFEMLLNSCMTKVVDNNFKQIAIDGKSIGNTDHGFNVILHLVSAFAPEVSSVVLQRKSEVAGG